MSQRGLDVVQVVEEIVRPVLTFLGPSLTRGPHVEQLLIGTAAVESSLVYIRQMGNGPALGLWQMEPATYRDHWMWMSDRANGGGDYADLISRVAALAARGSQPGVPPAAEMVWNLRLACAMSRVHYLRRREAIPVARTNGQADVSGLAHYWKTHYNTRLGAGTVDDFARAWIGIIAPAATRLWTAEGDRT